MSERIAIVDDDPQIRRLLRRCLESEGYDIVEAEDAASLGRLLEAGEVDLITLDLSLPDQDGFAVARELQGRVPIIMITGKGETIDRVVGLELGADDYITKPFHVREVLARVRSVLRRTGGLRSRAAPPEAQPSCGRSYLFDLWRLDTARRELVADDLQPLTLTTAEYDLLLAFVTHPGRVLSRDALMDLVKGQDWTPLDRVIDNAVSRLRRKLPEGTIKTVRGAGYMFTPKVRMVSEAGERASSQP